MDFMQYFNLYLIIHMTWLIAIFENIGMLLKHLLRILKQKKSSFAPEEKTSDSKNFMFGVQWSCMMPHMLLYSNSLLC